jgi:hypothetical protein
MYSCLRRIPHCLTPTHCNLGQIMLLHGGSLKIVSEPGRQTDAVLAF